jgi:uncharacterized C2H2 Zn-finger protein
MVLKEIEVDKLKDARAGGCFHGEVWIRCPYCGKEVELVGYDPVLTRIKDGYFIIKCKRCKKYYKDRR